MSDPAAGPDEKADDQPVAGPVPGLRPEVPGAGADNAEEAAGAQAASIAAPHPSDEPLPSWIPPRGADRPMSRRRMGVIGGIALAITVLGGKVLLGFMTATLVSSALGAYFSGPFDRLPPDQRQALSARIQAAMGDSLEGLSEAEMKAKIGTIVAAGLPRLGDVALTDYFRTTGAGLEATDAATCATVARLLFKGGPGLVEDPAITKAIAGLDTSDLGRRAEIIVEAIEAESSNSPPARSVTAAASDAMWAALFARYPAADSTTVEALAGGTVVTDADACGAARHLYSTAMQLDPTHLGTLALIDVLP